MVEAKAGKRLGANRIRGRHEPAREANIQAGPRGTRHLPNALLAKPDIRRRIPGAVGTEIVTLARCGDATLSI